MFSGKKEPLWRAALYMRLSREDGDKAESDSIRGQRELLEEFAQKGAAFLSADPYVDDGYSGTDFVGVG